MPRSMGPLSRIEAADSNLIACTTGGQRREVEPDGRNRHAGDGSWTRAGEKGVFAVLNPAQCPYNRSGLLISRQDR